MDKEHEIQKILRQDLPLGEPVTENKIIETAKNILESVDWGDGKDLNPTQDKSVDWSDGEDH